MGKIIYYNSVIFILLYFILEIITGDLIYANKLDCVYLSCNRTFNYNFSTPNGRIKNLYQKDEWGFRGREKNINNIDILTVGGSTTNEKFIPLEKTWTEQLQNLFNAQNKKIDIVNAGIDGQSTVGHIWNFENWFLKINDLKIKYIFFYIGINEQFNNKKFINKNEKLKNKFLNLLKQNNGITNKLYQNVYKKNFLKNDVYVGHFTTSKDESYNLVKNKIIITDQDKIYFRNNLKKIKELTLLMNSEPIFITQKTLRGVEINSKIFSINEKDYFSYEREIAEIIMEFCFEEDIKCVDINRKLKFEKDDFYDLIHTNQKGSKKIAEIIYSELNSLSF
jgi:lysophospholipase L1-like esterase